MSYFIVLKTFVWKCINNSFPTFYVYIRYFLVFHKKLNLSNPKNLNEKILYLSLKTDTSCWSTLADKYKVRQYVESNGYKEILTQLYGVWEEAEKIDFESLPQAFVLKVNHGCGDALIVRDKNIINSENRRGIMLYFSNLLKKKYGTSVERHYSKIKPLIIAEELLINDDYSSKYSESLIDYKIWCFNGKPNYIFTCCNRERHRLDVQLYNLDWKTESQYIKTSSHYRLGAKLPKPKNLEYMLQIAEKLSKPFPCVRIDLYNIGGKVYFGEMTYTSAAGMMTYFTNEFLDKAGELIDIAYKH